MGRSSVVILALALASCGPKVKLPYDVGDDGLPVVNPDLDASLPVDPAVTTGVLKNGLTYYIERNARPASRAELRLVVKAGSVLEDEDQLGLAHFVEHMAFNGSENFSGNEIIYWLESVGSRFGSHLNAYTSFDETVYKLQLPTDRAGVIDRGLLVMEDWAGGLLFDPEECEKERGVVLEEWRLDQGVSQRVSDVTMPITFHNSRYLDRMPIGTGESLETFSCDAAKRFYETWYRPDLMAVMVVGDIDVAEVEKLVKKHFSGLENPEEERERTYFRVPGNEETIFGIYADPEIPQGSISVLDKIDIIEEDTHRAYRDTEVELLAMSALNERLALMGQDINAPFLGAGTGVYPFGYERGAQTLSISPKEGRELEALTVAMAEIERARRYGFTQAEIGRARQGLMRGMKSWFDEKATTESSTHVEELIRVFLTNEPMPGIDYEYAMAQNYIPEISVEEVNAYVSSSLMNGTDRGVIALMPEKFGVTVPTEADLQGALDAVAMMELAPPEEEAATRPLMTEMPTPGKVVEREADAALGTQTVVLSNGVKVVMKPTDYKADEIMFFGASPGGLSLVTDEEYVSGVSAVELMLRSGLGDQSLVELSKLMAGRRATVTPFIGEYEQGFSGFTSQDDLEMSFQMMYLAATAPRFEQEAFDMSVQARTESLRNEISLPEYQSAVTWSEAVWGESVRHNPWSLEDVASINLETAERIYRSSFSDFGQMNFVMVGSFDPAEVEPLLEQYLGALPASGEERSWEDRGERRRPGVSKNRTSRGDTPRMRVRLLFHGEFEDSANKRMMLSGVEEYLQTELSEVLREDLGGTYGVQASASSWNKPNNGYQIMIDFEGDPEREAELVEAMWTVLDWVSTNAPSSGYVATMREQNRRSRETAERENGFWMSSLAGALRNGEDPRTILTYDERNGNLSPEGIALMASELLNREQYVMLIQSPLPEPAATETPAAEE